jgi:hypothetical protein
MKRDNIFWGGTDSARHVTQVFTVVANGNGVFSSGQCDDGRIEYAHQHLVEPVGGLGRIEHDERVALGHDGVDHVRVRPQSPE